MKSFTIVALLLLLGLSLNGQNKSKTDQRKITGSLSKEQTDLYLKKAKNLKTAGVIMTVLGSVSFVASTRGWIKVQNEGTGDPPFDKMKKYEIIMGLSAPLPLIGAICWLTGDSEERKISFTCFPVSNSAYVYGIGYKVRF